MPINFRALGQLSSSASLAEEFAPTDATIFVSSSILANDYNDGLSWGSAKRTISAALSALPLVSGKPFGTILIEPGTYTLSSTLTIGRLVNIIGAGSSLVTITSSVIGDAIRWTEAGAGFNVQQAGLLGGFTLQGIGSANQHGVHVGDIVGPSFDDVVIQNFTGSGSIGLWEDNTTHWTERLNATRLHLLNNTICLRQTVNGGQASFGYHRYLDVRFGVNDGQVGFQAENNVYSYNSLYTFLANITDAGTLFKLLNTAQIDHGMFIVDAEQSGTTGTAINLAAGTAMSGWGMFRAGGMAIVNANSPTFAHSLRILSPEAAPDGVSPLTDGGSIANFMGSGAAAQVVPQVIAGVDNPFGYGLLFGTNINSPYVVMFDFGGRNAFKIYKLAGGDALDAMVELFSLNQDGSFTINQQATIRSGTGAPAGGNSGDFYLRKDGGGAGATHLYFNNAGTWLGVA